jgi:uncharacterized membrane protein
VLNYFSATILGLTLNSNHLILLELVASSWLWISVIVGVLLIAGLYLIGYSTQKVGIAVTTVSNKMSVILPMLFSWIYYSETTSSIKLIGIILAFVSVFLSVYRKKEKRIDKKLIYLPVILFITIGLIDTFVKVAQDEYLDENSIPLFTAVSFSLAGLIGIILCFINSTKFKDFLNIKTVIFGFVLGGANFGSLYFLIFALNHSNLDSSIVYGVNNIAIISFSILIAFFAFKEKILKINWIGFVLAVISILLLTGFYKIFI